MRKASTERITYALSCMSDEEVQFTADGGSTLELVLNMEHKLQLYRDIHAWLDAIKLKEEGAA